MNKVTKLKPNKNSLRNFFAKQPPESGEVFDIVNRYDDETKYWIEEREGMERRKFFFGALLFIIVMFCFGLKGLYEANRSFAKNVAPEMIQTLGDNK